MGTHRRNAETGFVVPAWAALFTPSQYADFVRLVTAEQVQRGAVGDVHDGHLHLLDADGIRQELGLINLTQICKSLPLAKWPEVIAEFFECLGKSFAVAHDLMASLADFEKIRAQLKLRLYPEDHLRSDAHLLVRRKIADGVAAFLVCDLGYANVSVPAEFVATWQKPVAELFTLAEQNVRAEGRLQVHSSPHLHGFSVDVLTGETNYAATHLLFLEEYSQAVSGFGALVTVPNRHTLFRHVIEDRGVLEAIHVLEDVTQRAYKAGPGSISPDIYWWRPGQLRRLGVQRMGDTILFAPGEEFETAVLAPMARGN